MSVYNSKLKPSYSDEFKKQTIQLVIQSTKSISLIADELGIKKSTLYQWVKQYKKGLSEDSSTASPDLYQELNQLKKEFARVKEERDILKKAAQYFAKESR